jgi:hypothetical protein
MVFCCQSATIQSQNANIFTPKLSSAKLMMSQISQMENTNMACSIAPSTDPCTMLATDCSYTEQTPSISA